MSNKKEILCKIQREDSSWEDTIQSIAVIGIDEKVDWEMILSLHNDIDYTNYSIDESKEQAWIKSIDGRTYFYSVSLLK